MNLRDAYLRWWRRCTTAGSITAPTSRSDWIASDDLGGEATEEALGDVDGILIPGGFGVRGVEGKIDAVRYARERGVPFLGICLGLQCAVDRVRPQRLRPRGRQLLGVRPGDRRTP